MTDKEEWEEIYYEFSPSERADLLQQAIYRLPNSPATRETLPYLLTHPFSNQAWPIPILCVTLSVLITFAVQHNPNQQHAAKMLTDFSMGSLMVVLLAYTTALKLGVIKHIPIPNIKSIFVFECYSILGVGIFAPAAPFAQIPAFVFITGFACVMLLTNAITANIFTACLVKYRLIPV